MVNADKIWQTFVKVREEDLTGDTDTIHYITSTELTKFRKSPTIWVIIQDYLTRGDMVVVTHYRRPIAIISAYPDEEEEEVEQEVTLRSYKGCDHCGSSSDTRFVNLCEATRSLCIKCRKKMLEWV